MSSPTFKPDPSLSPEDLALVLTFRQAGMDASYHFADDTGKEWELAYPLQAKCYTLFREYPHLQAHFRDAARDFIFRFSPPAGA